MSTFRTLLNRNPSPLISCIFSEMSHVEASINGRNCVRYELTGNCFCFWHFVKVGWVHVFQGWWIISFFCMFLIKVTFDWPCTEVRAKPWHDQLKMTFPASHDTLTLIRAIKQCCYHVWLWFVWLSLTSEPFWFWTQACVSPLDPYLIQVWMAVRAGTWWVHFKWIYMKYHSTILFYFRI